jgi:hypothetical protein
MEIKNGDSYENLVQRAAAYFIGTCAPFIWTENPEKDKQGAPPMIL